MYYIYILECKNGSFYTGITTDPERRLSEHRKGIGAKYTRAFPPLQIVALWGIKGPRSLAQQLESKIKSLSRIEKLNLIKQPTELKKRMQQWGYSATLATLPAMPQTQNTAL